MSDIKETFEWNLERSSELLDMTDYTSHAMAKWALVGSVRHLIKALQIQSSDNTAEVKE